MADQFLALLERERPKLESVLQGNKYLTAERLIALGAQISSGSYGSLKQALNDYPSSVVNCFIQAAHLGIEPNTPLHHAALVPFKTKTGKYSCQLIVQYQGLVHLAITSGAADHVVGSLVFDDEIEQERFKENRTSRLEPIFHQPDARIRREPVNSPSDAVRLNVAGAYAVIFLPSGAVKAKYMGVDEIEYIRKTYSKAAEADSGKSPWEKRWSEMAIKTPLRNLMKSMRLTGTAPLLQKALELEEGSWRTLQEERELPPDNLPTAVEPAEAPAQSQPAAPPALKLTPKTPATGTIGDAEVGEIMQLWRKLHGGKMAGLGEWLLENFGVEDLSELPADKASEIVAKMAGG